MTSNETRPVVSDEALLDAYKAATDRYYNDNLLQPVDLMRDDIADEMRLAGIKAVREALAAAVPPVVIPDKLQKFEGFMLEDGRWFADTWTFARDFRHDGKRRFHQRGHGDDPVAALIDALRGDAAKAEVAS